MGVLFATLAAACSSGSASTQGPNLPGVGGTYRLGRGNPHARLNAGTPVIPSELTTMGRLMVFVSNRDSYYEIYMMFPDGTGQRPVTRSDFQNSWPALSPDGSRIAFARTVNDNTDIYVMNIDGTGLKRLTAFPGYDYHPTWSPDGRRIAWEGFHHNNAEIWVMNANGSHQVDITRNPSLDGSPAWSPNGREIVFESARGNLDELYEVRPNGNGLAALTDTKGENTDPAWSPNGRTIAFSSTRNGPPRLYVMHPDGSAQTMVSAPESGLGPGVAKGAWADTLPAWSPDGAWLAFQTTRSGVPQVWAMRPDGQAAIALTQFGANGNPSWGG